MHVRTTQLSARRHVETVSLGKRRELSVSCEKRWGIGNCKLTGIHLSSSAICCCKRCQVATGRNVIATRRCSRTGATSPPYGAGLVADVEGVARSGGPDSRLEG